MSRKVRLQFPRAAFRVCSKHEDDDVMACKSKYSAQFKGSWEAVGLER